MHETISRRNVLEMSLALALSGTGSSVLARALSPTQSEIMGPFYPNPKLVF